MVQTKDIKLRQMKISDLDALMEIKNAEHWNQTQDDWIFLINHYPKYCLVAEVDNQVVGTVTSTNFNKQVGWIGMMLVRKPYRGLGISRQLMSSVIKMLSDDCKSIKLDATPAGEKVYEKLGFKKEYEVFRITNTEKDHPSLQQPTIVQQIDVSILDPLKAEDQKVFGSDRGTLIDYLIRQKTNGHGYLGSTENFEGYVLSRFGTNYTQIGPVIAGSTEIAKVLIDWSYSRIKGPAVIDIPAEKAELIRWLESRGFEIQRKFIRMYLKSNAYPGIPQRCYGIAGPEYG